MQKNKPSPEQVGFEAGENFASFFIAVFPFAITTYFFMRIFTAGLGVVGMESDFFQYSNIMKGVILTPSIIGTVLLRIFYPSIGIVFVILGSLSFIGTYFS